MIRLVLPVPPSVNALFANNVGRGRKGRRVTPAYTEWRWHALVSLRAQVTPPAEGKPPLLSGRCKLRLFVGEKMRGDPSNRIKAVEDFLVAHRITGDDRNNRHVSIEANADVAPTQIVVEVESLDPTIQAVTGARGEVERSASPSIRERRRLLQIASRNTEGTGART